MNGRLISAEVLRLRKSRALVIWLTVLTTGAVTAFYTSIAQDSSTTLHRTGLPAARSTSAMR